MPEISIVKESGGYRNSQKKLSGNTIEIFEPEIEVVKTKDTGIQTMPTTQQTLAQLNDPNTPTKDASNKRMSRMVTIGKQSFKDFN